MTELLLGLSLNQWAVLQAWAPHIGLAAAQDCAEAIDLLGEWESQRGMPPSEKPLIAGVERPADRSTAYNLFRAVRMEAQ